MSKLRSLFVALLALAFLVPSSWAGILTHDSTPPAQNVCALDYNNYYVGYYYFTDLSTGNCLPNMYSPQVNPGGTGDLLMFPLFYADASTKTKIRVVNTNPRWGIVAKVILRSSMCSEELRDFLIFLSPNDVWTGEVTIENGNVVIKSTDDSVIVPNNHKAASESNPFVYPLRPVANPNDVNNFGYIEVIAVAKVNWGWSDGSKTFKALARENGFENLHEFMYFLYNPAVPWVYASVAYCGNSRDLAPRILKGLIAPLAYDSSTVGSDFATYDPNCVPGDSIEGNFTEHIDAPLYGTAEVMIPGGYAAYRAVAVRGFVALGTILKADGCTGTDAPCVLDYSRTGENPAAGLFAYKVPASIDTPLNYAGVVDALDEALVKREMYIPYYDTDDSDGFGSFALLFSPTMQTRYAYCEAIDRYTCLPTPFVSSTLWSERWNDVLSGRIAQLVFGYQSFDNSEHRVSCEVSPCLLQPYELYPIGTIRDIYDPFFYSEGWLKAYVTSSMNFRQVRTCDNSVISLVRVRGVPMIPIAGFYNADGVTFVEPGYMQGSISP